MRLPLPQLNGHAIHRDTPAPWIIVRTFATQKKCEARREAASPWGRCIASDDPRLKGKIGAFILTRLRSLVQKQVRRSYAQYLMCPLTNKTTRLRHWLEGGSLESIVVILAILVLSLIVVALE